MLRGGAYKPRTSPYDFQGLGVKGLRYLADARERTGLPVVTEVLSWEEVAVVAHFADMLQIGARNMQNFTLLRAASRSGKPILLKRGAGATIEEWLMAAEYILAEGNPNVVLCERGIRTFERATRHTLDLNAVVMVRERTHLPVIVDPSHAAGVRSLVVPLGLGSLAAGACGLLVEVHPDPDRAMSDGAQSLDLPMFADLAARVHPGREASRPARGLSVNVCTPERSEGDHVRMVPFAPLSLTSFAVHLPTALRNRRPSPSHEQPVQQQQEHRADDRGDDPRTLAGVGVPAQGTAEEAGQQGASHADQHGDDEPAGILPGHQKLGDRADDQPDDQGPQDSHSSLQGWAEDISASRVRTSVSGRTGGSEAQSSRSPMRAVTVSRLRFRMMSSLKVSPVS